MSGFLPFPFKTCGTLHSWSHANSPEPTLTHTPRSARPPSSPLPLARRHDARAARGSRQACTRDARNGRTAAFAASAARPRLCACGSNSDQPALAAVCALDPRASPRAAIGGPHPAPVGRARLRGVHVRRGRDCELQRPRADRRPAGPARRNPHAAPGRERHSRPAARRLRRLPDNTAPPGPLVQQQPACPEWRGPRPAPARHTRAPHDQPVERRRGAVRPPPAQKPRGDVAERARRHRHARRPHVACRTVRGPGQRNHGAPRPRARPVDTGARDSSMLRVLSAARWLPRGLDRLQMLMPMSRSSTFRSHNRTGIPCSRRCPARCSSFSCRERA